MNPDNFFQAMAASIRIHRKKAGLTQQQLAKFAGVGKTVVFDVEHGKSSVRFDSLYKILIALNITLSINSPLIEHDKREDHA